jgi:outer membrane protein OmpA-like peptidoglycan-associated protein
MAQTVDRLKELLFDSEARAIETLNQRLVSVEHSVVETATTTQAERAEREKIEAQVDQLLRVAGTSERFERSVALALDGALRQAEVERHHELASAVAPLVVRTIKTEIHNSRDELVETLYPMTGRMVQAYVASAMKDLANDINRRLEQNAFMLRLRSMASGKSMAEVAMADSQRIQIDELYLIRRGTGELVGRWPAASADDDNHDHVMSGVLTAINEFSSQALNDGGSSLRQIDVGGRQLYLRTSPLFLLAAKCSGTAQPPMEAVLDQAFLSALERLQASSTAETEADAIQSRTNILASLSTGVETELEFKANEMAEQSGGLSPLKALLYVIGLPLAGLLMWQLLGQFKTERVRTLAERARAETPEIAGYPVTLDVEPGGYRLTVTGLAPSSDVRTNFIERIERLLPNTPLDNRLSVLPSGLSEVEPRIEGVKSSVDRLTPEVARVTTQMDALKARIADATALSKTQSDQYAKETAALVKQNEKLAQELAALRAIKPPEPSKPIPPEVSSRDRLVAFTRAKAVFFRNDTDLKDPERARSELDELASLLRNNALLLRIVGYTDGQGAQARNEALSAARARVVVQELVNRGIPESRVVALGRVDSVGISPDKGPDSPNRRVEFEVGFEGEGENR